MYAQVAHCADRVFVRWIASNDPIYVMAAMPPLVSNYRLIELSAQVTGLIGDSNSTYKLYFQ
ncbi:hypothetical protein SCLCIDRAFT_1213806 [Scleroderma citrinum Foug A]|uniref:Uncharacterized protein n=1 Tax=Scleroderma citrinum Foug A TaxID=1036808 RepID=A0A0C3E6B3_9AGAM|nr:hypothetical protein SCLCIDRAFT_1213806 [Scleroderma citrinum Foug A]